MLDFAVNFSFRPHSDSRLRLGPAPGPSYQSMEEKTDGEVPEWLGSSPGPSIFHLPYELNAPYEWVWWRSDHEQQDQRRATFAYGRRITGRRVAGRCHAPASHGSSRALPEAARKIHRKSAPMLPGSVSTLPGKAAIRSFDRCHGVDFELVK